MSVIEVKNLIKKYNKAEVNAVDDISFSVDEGEFFAFLGPNGAGKTTTISILTTTLSKTSGTVTIAGHDLDKGASEVRNDIGVIFQKPSLDENLTAEENIRFHAMMYNLYAFKPSYHLMSQEYKDKVSELASVLKLNEEIFKPVKTFSGGMKRKLEIMRTLIHKPKILFLDEPTSGLDPLSRKNLWDYLNSIRKEFNTTIFLTTHYLEEAEDAGRVCIINHGKIIINDTIDNIKNKLVKDYIYLESKNKDQLRNDLKTFDYKFVEENGGFKINTKVTNAQKIIKGVSAELHKIEISKPTLEEAYLDLIEEKDLE